MFSLRYGLSFWSLPPPQNEGAPARLIFGTSTSLNWFYISGTMIACPCFVKLQVSASPFYPAI